VAHFGLKKAAVKHEQLFYCNSSMAANMVCPKQSLHICADLMHGSILPVTIPPPGNPGDKSSPSVPGVGNCLKPSCPGGGGKSNITSCCSCEVRHFSVDAGPRGEDCLFPVRISRICSRLVREE